jgi:para-nitrobenzyl esterase
VAPSAAVEAAWLGCGGLEVSPGGVAMATVATTRGSVRGRTTPQGVDAFLGIPYAEPPTGERRWAPPVPRTPWPDPLDATKFGPAAWQPVGGPLEGLVPGMAAEIQGDDCLTLNIWTPAANPGPDDPALAVMVWIHGGAFSIGAGSLEVYDGARLAAHEELVVVSVNYRLGALGFLVIDDDRAAPNVGLLDLAAALEWVHDNIAAFGGDPGNVTIFGESAGGGCVLSLLSMPGAEGLFHKAIVQSGATELVLPHDRALPVAQGFALAAGLEKPDLDALRALDATAMLDAQQVAAGALLATVGLMPFHPCADGVVMPLNWQAAAEAGINASVPVIIGTTRDEMRLFASFDPTLATLDDDGLRKRVGTLHRDPDAVIEAYRTDDPELSAADLWQGVQTDTSMWMPALQWAAARAERAPVWMYRFDWPAADPAMGAPHAVDIPFPFDTIDEAGWDAFVSDPPGAHRLARTIQSLWATFARSGDPATASISWPRFDVMDRATLILDDSPHIESDPRSGIRAQWSHRPR